MQITDLYCHNVLKEYVQVTAIAGNWVEFLSKNKSELRWLEQMVFNNAYSYIDRGDPITEDLSALRSHAKNLSILIPKEFNYT